ncbi:MAG: methyltransferase domain-containing protein [Candidatus Zixiibacteriota bacterium]
MSSYADSDAILEINKILPQHQAALTLLNGKLQNPIVGSFKWLDLACGKGQVISQLNDNLSPTQRGKLIYLGYDINVEFTRAAERIADSLQLADYNFEQGEMSKFNEIIDTDLKFDFITCTNTAHELQPGAFAQILLNSMTRLTTQGELFVYDMESLEKPELGALPWHTSEIKTLLYAAFEELGTDFRAEPSGWIHKSCRGWSVTIQRHFLNKSDEDIINAKDKITSRIDKEIDTILHERLKVCNKKLQSFYRFGADTGNDYTTLITSLFEFWALNMAIGKRVC